MSKDYGRLRDVLQKIHNEPQKWNQGAWARQSASCGTSMCFAGWTTQMAGALPIWEGDYTTTSFCVTPGGEEKSISNYAGELLGLTVDERRSLFEGRNDEEVIASIIQRWASHDEELLAEAYAENGRRQAAEVGF